MTSRRVVGRERAGLAGAAAFLLALALAVSLGQPAAAAPGPQAAVEGQALFDRLCAVCHTVGGGDLLGPDLKGVTILRETEWLSRWILDPGKMLADGDPTAVALLKKYNNVPMPNLGLSAGEVASLIAYLEAADAAPGEGADPEATRTGEVQAGALPEGDPVVGKNLFTGGARFQNGGPPCLACHSVSGIGALGGGALGPDLTGAHQRLGDAMIAWPENVAPMKAVYSGKPLTGQEKAHLLGFFRSGPLGQRSTQAVWQLTGLAVAGVAVVLMAAGLVWRRRLRSVRGPMVTGQGRRSA